MLTKYSDGMVLRRYPNVPYHTLIETLPTPHLFWIVTIFFSAFLGLNWYPDNGIKSSIFACGWSTTGVLFDFWWMHIFFLRIGPIGRTATKPTIFDLFDNSFVIKASQIYTASSFLSRSCLPSSGSAPIRPPRIVRFTNLWFFFHFHVFTNENMAIPAFTDAARGLCDSSSFSV